MQTQATFSFAGQGHIAEKETVALYKLFMYHLIAFCTLIFVTYSLALEIGEASTLKSFPSHLT